MNIYKSICFIALKIPFDSNGGNFLCSLRAVPVRQPGFTDQCVCGRKKKVSFL